MPLPGQLQRPPISEGTDQGTQISDRAQSCLRDLTQYPVCHLACVYLENIHDSDGSSSSSHQNPKSADKWAASLENLLEDPEGVKRFREFLKKEFSEENVLFWLACEDFKKTQDKKQMQEKAKEIYMTFLSSKASSQVNVEGQSRLNETILEEPHPLMFQKLQDQACSRNLCSPGLPFHFPDLH
ncbi:regulator of G-protein signaling 10 isoform X2 [Sagmatias obliquidens]|uniref:regulator of G-protein signaling 10 isoform X2 n=1 Tax=Sagmatias obliquidens TaxID=3371155 RepID=UPI000F43F4C3|nr:regulator of G-protein signaling 10 isoform X2 [Lagenorhynchus obliquidens]